MPFLLTDDSPVDGFLLLVLYFFQICLNLDYLEICQQILTYLDVTGIERNCFDSLNEQNLVN